MATATHPTRMLRHSPLPARIEHDGLASGGPFPTMSARAALIARSIGVTLLLAWLAVTDTRLLVVLAFAVPFWIAIEVEVYQRRPKRAASLSAGSSVNLRALDRRPSYPPDDHPKAA